MAKLTTIEGIGPRLAGKLKKGGIGSTGALLKAGATKKGRRQICRDCELDEGRILKWVNHADLMRVRGIGGEYAELLEAAGVDSVPELRRRNSVNLATRMQEVNRTKRMVRQLPGPGTVAKWVSQARTLERVVTH